MKHFRNRYELFMKYNDNCKGRPAPAGGPLRVPLGTGFSAGTVFIPTAGKELNFKEEKELCLANGFLQ